MEKRIYCAGSSPANHFAERFLTSAGFPLAYGEMDAQAVLLDVPTREEALENALDKYGENVVILGGNFSDEKISHRKHLDLLKDENYLAANAAITAHCAIRLAMTALPVILPQAKTLVLGWGRIGKVIAQLLRQMGTPLTVTARKEKDIAALRSLGYHVCKAEEAPLEGVRLIINTAPQVLLSKKQLEKCPLAVKLDLASKKCLFGEDTLWARGLPGIHAPESSGRLIADTIERYHREGKI